ncbi:MAG: cell division protein CrgA [Ornithinimicrobium sp.]|uniref:cell division protein CrgA n=1 Tax=Ornithinimicrobium sp. TaxID=1977084 RepID=UPI003D9B669B
MPDSPGRSTGKKPPKNSGNPANRREAMGRPEPRKQKVGNPSWWVPVMCALMIVGVLWVATFYISQGRFPVEIGYWNLVVGMGLIMTGFLMTTRWK